MMVHEYCPAAYRMAVHSDSHPVLQGERAVLTRVHRALQEALFREDSIGVRGMLGCWRVVVDTRDAKTQNVPTHSVINVHSQKKSISLILHNEHCPGRTIIIRTVPKQPVRCSRGCACCATWRIHFSKKQTYKFSLAWFTTFDSALALERRHKLFQFADTAEYLSWPTSGRVPCSIMVT